MKIRNHSCKYYQLLDYDHFECSIQNDPDRIGLGFTIGSTSFKGDKRDNLYIDFQFLTLTFGIEIKNLRK